MEHGQTRQLTREIRLYDLLCGYSIRTELKFVFNSNSCLEILLTRRAVKNVFFSVIGVTMFVIRVGRTPIIGEQQTDVEGFTCKISTVAPF